MRHSPLGRENLIMTWQRCKIGGKLVLITNIHSFIRIRLIETELQEVVRKSG